MESFYGMGIAGVKYTGLIDSGMRKVRLILLLVAHPVLGTSCSYCSCMLSPRSSNKFQSFCIDV